MEQYFRRAIANVTRHGDTDIFPYPIENHVFYDNPNETVQQLANLHSDFKKWLASNPPEHEGALIPVSYTGFRWGTQLDPLWNLYFLALVLSIADKIEAVRVPISEDCVFSYRYSWNESNATIFHVNQNWRTFMECSLRRAEAHAFVVLCDISEFYPRLLHHRLENALGHLGLTEDTPWRLIKFLTNFSNTNSFGLPIGGPAARILSELALNQIDQLLKLEWITFCRFSDDFHLFASSMEDAFEKLLTLTEKLQRNQGLQLQKAKTRIMSSPEFVSTSPIILESAERGITNPADNDRNLMQFSLRFDPYSPTAADDYELLKNEVRRFDLIGLLQAELSKSRIHIALSRKIVAAIRYLEPIQRDQAILSLMANAELLYPIYYSVLLTIRQVFDDLSGDTQASIATQLLTLIQNKSHVLRVEIVLAYAIRVLASRPSDGVQEMLVRVYSDPGRSPLVRRDIILAMTRLGAWYWLSDRRTYFRQMNSAERRAFIVASYFLKDEGKNWRDHTTAEFSPLEILVRNWAASKIQNKNWVVPL